MSFKKTLLSSLLISSGIITSPATVFANDSSELEQLRALVQELDQKVRVLDRKSELAAETAAAEKKAAPVVSVSEKGFSLKSADGKNEIKFRGLIQADHRHYNEGSKDVRNRSRVRAGELDENGFADTGDTSLLRRVRPTIEGKVLDKYAFRFTPEFAGGSASAVDAYVDANFAPTFNVRAGKFKSFVGLERLQGGGDIKFIERSYVTNAILPNRDLGAAVYGSVLDKKLDYAFGIVNGVADGGNISTGSEYNDEREYTARLFASPFKDQDSVLAGLGFGIGATYTDFRGEQNLNWTDTSAADATRNGLPSYVSEGQNTFFRYGANAVANGKRLRWSPQANYYNGPFGFITEYARVSQDVSLTERNPGGTTTQVELADLDGTKRRLDHDAWEVAASYLLTGEDASFKGVKPKRDFDLDKGGWGAWELVARYSRIDLDEDTFKNRNGQYAGENRTAPNTINSAYADGTLSAESAQTWTLGVNWYLNQNAKVALNYLQTSFDGGASSDGATANAAGSNIKDRDDEKALFARFQVAF
ncbi:MAG: OprO/OprP family phosphate-selective porin [Methylophilaceae bacterium]